MAPKEPDSKIIAVRLDIEMQLKESRALQAERSDMLDRLKSRLRVDNLALRRATDAYELARRGHATAREGIVSELSRRVGFLESEIQVLQKRLELAAAIDRLSKQKEELLAHVARLKNTIEAIIARAETPKAGRLYGCI